MHLNHDALYFIIGVLAGGLGGTVLGFCLFGAWMMGLLFPATVPEHLATNDHLSQIGKARSRVLDELPFAGSDKYNFWRDELGNVSYSEKIPYAGDGEG